MNINSFSFMLTFIAGLSTMIGTIFIFFKMKKKEKVIATSLSFAAGVMTCVSFIELIPEGFQLITKTYFPFYSLLLVLFFINIGIIISSLIDHFMPEKNNKLYKVGLISMLAIILHNIPEGIATFLAGTTNTSLGISLTVAIALHNIPEGISISIPIYYATKNKGKAIFYTFLSGISEPFGALLAFLFLKNRMTDTIMGMLFCFIAGIMLHISFYELLKEAKEYEKKKWVYAFFTIGVLFMGITQFIFH